MEGLTLPKEDYVPEVGGIPSDFSMILFGPPKIGKTTFGAAWPKSIVLECEPGGAQYIKCRKLDIGSLDELRSAWDLLKADKSYETIIIDTLDRVAQWVEVEICAELGLKHIMDTKKGERIGSQWGEYVNRILILLEGWKRLGKRVIFIGHTKKAETDGQGMVISPKTINLYGQAANRVMSIVDNIGFMYPVEDDKGRVIRRLSFKPGIAVEAGSRHPSLTDRAIDIPKNAIYPTFAAMFSASKENNTKEVTKTTEKAAKPAGGAK